MEPEGFLAPLSIHGEIFNELFIYDVYEGGLDDLWDYLFYTFNFGYDKTSNSFKDGYQENMARDKFMPSEYNDKYSETYINVSEHIQFRYVKQLFEITKLYNNNNLLPLLSKYLDQKLGDEVNEKKKKFIDDILMNDFHFNEKNINNRLLDGIYALKIKNLYNKKGYEIKSSVFGYFDYINTDIFKTSIDGLITPDNFEKIAVTSPNDYQTIINKVTNPTVRIPTIGNFLIDTENVDQKDRGYYIWLSINKYTKNNIIKAINRLVYSVYKDDKYQIKIKTLLKSFLDTNNILIDYKNRLEQTTDTTDKYIIKDYQNYIKYYQRKIKDIELEIDQISDRDLLLKYIQEIITEKSKIDLMNSDEVILLNKLYIKYTKNIINNIIKYLNEILDITKGMMKEVDYNDERFIDAMNKYIQFYEDKLNFYRELSISNKSLNNTELISIINTDLYDIKNKRKEYPINEDNINETDFEDIYIIMDKYDDDIKFFEKQLSEINIPIKKEITYADLKHDPLNPDYRYRLRGFGKEFRYMKQSDGSYISISEVINKHNLPNCYYENIYRSLARTSQHLPWSTYIEDLSLGKEISLTRDTLIFIASYDYEVPYDVLVDLSDIDICKIIQTRIKVVQEKFIQETQEIKEEQPGFILRPGGLLPTHFEYTKPSLLSSTQIVNTELKNETYALCSRINRDPSIVDYKEIQIFIDKYNLGYLFPRNITLYNKIDICNIIHNQINKEEEFNSLCSRIYQDEKSVKYTEIELFIKNNNLEYLFPNDITTYNKKDICDMIPRNLGWNTKSLSIKIKPFEVDELCNRIQKTPNQVSWNEINKLRLEYLFKQIQIYQKNNDKNKICQILNDHYKNLELQRTQMADIDYRFI
jgi:hypothetical protein